MAAKSKKKKVIQKDDLRRLMKEKQTSLKQSNKTIDSPLAKYNSLGQLSCALCNCPVKSELMWNAHLQGRTHKENVVRLKEEKARKEHQFVQPLPPSSILKRKSSNTNQHDQPKQKKAGISKGGLPADFFDGNSSTSKASGSQALGLAYESSSSDEDEEDTTTTPSASATKAVSGLPSDFFDPGVKPSASDEPSEEAAKSTTIAEQLPEGFFDDPKMDAKVRKVEYRDKLDDEWDLFQRAMKDENTVSEAIMDEDDDVINAERKITEIDEQMHQYSKITSLAKKKEEIMSHQKDVDKTEEEDEDDMEAQEFEEFLDWRSKNVSK